MADVTLEPAEIVRTLERLERRIEERFPGAGLADVARTLGGLARTSAAEAARLERPDWLLRLLVVAVLAGGAFGIWSLLPALRPEADAANLFSLAQGIESLMNIALVGGAAIFSLVTIETRIRRTRALKAIHPFRALVHVIDMHQLTKDPTFTHGATVTSASPKRDLTPFQLSRYLDYCSEMLSLTAKIAALYAIASSDPAVTTAVNEIEQLTASLSQKIWAKIMIITAGDGAPA